MSDTQKTQLEVRQQLLDDYEKTIGLPANRPPGDENELQSYLSMTRTMVESLDAHSAAAVAVRLSQFSLYFQRAINRERSNKTWANEQLTFIVCKDILQYDKYTPNKIELICRENKAADELRRIAIYAQQRIERLEELAAGLRNISYVLGLVCKAKLGENS